MSPRDTHRRAQHHGGIHDPLYGELYENENFIRSSRSLLGSDSNSEADYSAYDGRRRMAHPPLTEFNLDRALRRGHRPRGAGTHNEHHTRSVALRMPSRAPQPQISHDEVFLFPQHILHLTVHMERHGGRLETFRAAVPSGLTAEEIMMSVGLSDSLGYRVVLRWTHGEDHMRVQELSRDSRLSSVVRQVGRRPSILHIEGRRR